MKYDPPAETPDSSLPREITPLPIAEPASRRKRWRWRSGRAAYLRKWWQQPQVRWAVPVLAAVAVGAVGGIAVAAAISIPDLDEQTTYQPGLITRVVDRSGVPFSEFARERRILLDENEVPEVLQNAIVAVEDSRFFLHGGIDAEGVARAAVVNLLAGRKEEGASTLTMQLARTLLQNRAKTWKRKIEEAFTAVELEKRFSKQQILTQYCNLMNLGHGNYGMAQAARYFFDKTVDQLELHEAAMLAGIPQRPSSFSPYRKPQAVMDRRNWVLYRMRKEGYIDEATYQDAVRRPLDVVPQRPRQEVAPYFAEDVRKYVESTYGTRQLLEGGLTVEATLDLEIQQAAEQALASGLRKLDHRKGWRGPVRQLKEEELEGKLEDVELDSWPDSPLELEQFYEGVVLDADKERAVVKLGPQTYELTAEGMSWTRRKQPSQLLERGDVAWFRLTLPEPEGEAAETAAGDAEPRLTLEQQPELQGALLVLESATGAIRALVGGWDFDRSKFNRVTQAHRQVGSAFKLFVWGAALEAGYTPADTLFDGPTYFLGADNKPSYRPRNFDREYYGIVTLRRALEKSMNMTAVKLMDMVGVERTIDFARRCGIESELPRYPSLALGVTDMTPLELAGAYAAVANQGTWVRPYLIDRITTPKGRVLEEHVAETRTAMEPQIAYLLTHLLEGVVDRGTATDLRSLDLAVAGKTGTTDNFTDAWFAGFTPRYTLVVWTGYDTPRSIGRNMTGAEAAIPIWKDLAERGLEQGWLEKGAEFAPPPGVVHVAVERGTGLLVTADSSYGIREAFIQGTEPVRAATAREERILELPWYQQRAFYIPKEGERMPDDFEDVARVDDWTDQR